MLNPLKDVLTVEMVRSLIAKIKGALATKVSMGDVVSSWQSTPDDAHVPTEKLVKDTLDNLPPGTAVKGDAESEYRTGNVNLTPANIGAATASQGDKADSAVQGVKVNGTELSKDSNNKVDVPVPTASTATPLKDGTASAGSSSQWARGDHRHPTDDSREAVSNKKQVVNDSSTTEYPSSKAVADFVNSSVATNTANFLGTISESSLGLDYTATNAQIALALNVHSWESTPTNNDYCFVSVNNPQTTDVDEYRRFKFNGSVWAYEYTLNNSSFTQAQWDAINSGLTSSDRTAYNAAVTLLNSHVADTSIHVTTAEKNAWNAKQNTVSTDTDSSAFGDNTTIATGFSGDKLHLNIASRLWTYIQGKISSVLGLTSSSYGGKAATATTATNYASGGDIDTALQGKYVKPISGIPKTDLASDVQTSLGKADTALQSQSVTDNNPTLAWGTTSTVGTVESTNLRVTMPSNPASGKQDTVSTDTDSSAFGDNTAIATGFGSNKLHLNIASRLWTYIQEKISTVLGLTSSSYGGKASTAGTADSATNYTSGGGIDNALNTLSKLSRTRIGTTAVDLNDFAVDESTNKLHIYEWLDANKDNVANKPTNNPGILLNLAYSTTTCYQLVISNGTAYERTKSITWSSWKTRYDASWINSGTFDAARIPTITPSMVESGSPYPIATTGLNAYISKPLTGYGKEDLVIAKIIKVASNSHSGITLLVTQGDNYGGAENQGIYIIQAAYRGSARLVVTKIREGYGFAGVWYYTDNDYMYVVYRRADYSGNIAVNLMGRMANADTTSEIAPSGVTLTEATYRELAVANGSYSGMTVGSANSASNVNLSKTVNAVNGDSIRAGTGASVTIGNAGNAKTWDSWKIAVDSFGTSADTIYFY